MLRISVLVLSLCFTACSATSASAPQAPAAARNDGARVLFERGLALIGEGDSVRAEQYLAAALRRVRDGSRRLTHITEVLGCDEHNQYQLQDLFVLEHGDLAQRDAQRENAQRGEHAERPVLVPTGVLPACLEALRMHGHDLSQAVYAAAKRRQR